MLIIMIKVPTRFRSCGINYHYTRKIFPVAVDVANTKDIFAVTKNGNLIDNSSLDQIKNEISEGLYVSNLEK